MNIINSIKYYVEPHSAYYIQPTAMSWIVRLYEVYGFGDRAHSNEFDLKNLTFGHIPVKKQWRL